MANEPSWEDIFNPQPRTSQPAAQPETPPAYPPTQAFPAPAETHAQVFATTPVPSAPVPPVDNDPFAQLFGALETNQIPAQQPAPAPLLAPPAAQPMAPAAYSQQPYQPPTAASAPATSFPVAAPATAPDAQPDPFAGLFAAAQSNSSAPVAAASFPATSFPATPVASGATPLTRRELREREQGAQSTAESAPAYNAAYPPFDGGGAGSRGGNSGGSSGGGGYQPAGKPKKKRSLLWLKITLPIVLVLGLAGGAAAYAWFNFNDQVREVMGWQLPNDFEGAGNGQEVIVTVQSGDIGSDVANTLHDAGVTMTFDAFYELLLTQPENVNFIPGNYSLQAEMSAQSALDALLDPANKVTSKLLITEGTILPSALEIMAETTGIPLEEFQTAAADFQQFGLPAEAPSLEGYLFPATYELDGSETAVGLLQLLVDTTFERLDAAGVAVDQRHVVLTKASIIQREAGPNTDDFYKIARVFQNRLDQGINLQSDATVVYGTGNFQTVWTTDEERADASNLYNTYANPGLPIGPIGAPGDIAIAAALAPADGPWLFFVPINLATGETVFSETADEHEAAVEQLRAWCDASAENSSYCE